MLFAAAFLSKETVFNQSKNPSAGGWSLGRGMGDSLGRGAVDFFYQNIGFGPEIFFFKKSRGRSAVKVVTFFLKTRNYAVIFGGKWSVISALRWCLNSAAGLVEQLLDAFL